jgi:glucose/mannose-6-phosphate isomerase
MLDDLKLIHERDAQDTLGIAAGQWQQLNHAFSPSGNTAFDSINNIVYAAMGGSAMAASMIMSWPKLSKPFEVVRDYDLPGYVSADTLVILSSYSGNTEETLSALKQAEAKGAQIAIVTAGGTLQKTAEDQGYLLMRLPQTAFARCGTFANFKAVLEILAIAGVLQPEDFTGELGKTATFLQEACKAWLPDVATSKNPAKQLAQELIGKSIVVYGGPKMYPAAYKWKLGFNENAKQLAWANQLPEYNHNELTGWTKQPVDKPYAVIDLKSSLEHPRVLKRFEVSSRLLSGVRPQSIEVEAAGEGILQHLAWLIVFGDFVGLYLAMLNGLNPVPLEMVDKLKQALSE